MSDQWENSLGHDDSWPRFILAVLIGAVATSTELLFGPQALLTILHLVAIAIATRLPRGLFVPLLAILTLMILLPAFWWPADDGLTARYVALSCMAIIAVLSLRETTVGPEESVERPSQLSLTGSSDGVSADEGGLHDSSRQESSFEEPSTLIRAPSRVDDDFAVFPDGGNDFVGNEPVDAARIVTKLKSSGQFSEDQIEMIESELVSLPSAQVTYESPVGLDVGDQVGRFVIDGPLGRGGVGDVYKGHDAASGEEAAIKVLHNVRVSERFRREMQMVEQLAHPNIVTAYESGEFCGLPFITMELLRGPDLNVHVRDQGPLGWLASTRYILQVTRALEHAHQRDLIHRDIKPGNIILNGEDVVKLVDLGLAAISPGALGHSSVLGVIVDQSQPQHETQEGHLAGTLAYMAPEQARSLAAANIRSDIFSLGATWFYLLTGKTRLRGESFSKQFENLLVRKSFRSLPNECLPDGLRKIYRRLIAYEPMDRIANCGDLAAELERALAVTGESVATDDINVLVVEDSHTDMLLTIEMLRRTNQSVTIHQAKSLAEGIESHRQNKMDMVLLDLTLPDSSGIETVASFRHAAPRVPIVVLTGLSEEEASDACLRAGATSFVSKSGLSAHKLERTIFITLSRFGINRPAS